MITLLVTNSSFGQHLEDIQDTSKEQVNFQLIEARLMRMLHEEMNELETALKREISLGQVNFQLIEANMMSMVHEEINTLKTELNDKTSQEFMAHRTALQNWSDRLMRESVQNFRENRDYQQKLDDKLNTMVSQEITGRLVYLQQLDDKFYKHVKFWVSFLSGAGAILLALFLWSASKMRREASEHAKQATILEAKAIAKEAVDKIIVPDAIRERVEEVLEEANHLYDEIEKQTQTLKKSILREAEDELKETKRQIVKDQHDAILNALNEAIKTKFEQELDLMERQKELEIKVASLYKEFAPVKDAVIDEATKQRILINPDLFDAIRSKATQTQKFATMIADLIIKLDDPVWKDRDRTKG